MDPHQIKMHLKLDSITSLVDRPEVKVLKVRTSGKTHLLKMHTRQNNFEREVDSINNLADTFIPVPRIFMRGRHEQYYYFLQEWWDGVPLANLYDKMSRTKQLEILYEAGRLLARIQVALRPEELANTNFWRYSEEKQCLQDVSWCKTKVKQFYKWRGRLKLTLQDRALSVEKCLDYWESQLSYLQEPPELTLLHNDYGFRNLMYFQEGPYSLGVFDFENASVGDPTHDLVKLTYNDVEPDDQDSIQYFLEGYRRHSPYAHRIQLFDLYQALEGLAAMAWVDKQQQPSPEDLKFRIKGRDILLKRTLQSVPL